MSSLPLILCLARAVGATLLARWRAAALKGETPGPPSTPRRAAANGDEARWQSITAHLESIQAELAATRKELAALRLILEAFIAPQNGSDHPEDEEASDSPDEREAEADETGKVTELEAIEGIERFIGTLEVYEQQVWGDQCGWASASLRDLFTALSDTQAPDPAGAVDLAHLQERVEEARFQLAAFTPHCRSSDIRYLRQRRDLACLLRELVGHARKWFGTFGSIGWQASGVVCADPAGRCAAAACHQRRGGGGLGQID